MRTRLYTSTCTELQQQPLATVEPPPQPAGAARHDAVRPEAPQHEAPRRDAPRPDAGPATLSAWRHAVREGVSLNTLLQQAHARVMQRAFDPAWITRTHGAQIERRIAELEEVAKRFPNRSALLEAHPLWGVPFAIKDNIDAAGWPTTAACPAFARTAAHDASVVHRLQQAGAVLMGKTNLDQFATGLVGTRSPYGKPASVFDADRVSGGSSSGSAVVVARGDVIFALGTDTAGSGRVPAAFNHIVGLKPTPGRASTAGVLPACRSLDCVSVFALSAEDAGAVLALIEGADPADAYSRFAPGPARWPAGLRIGVPAAVAADPALGFDGAWSEALALARRLSEDCVPIDFEPLHQVARLLYEGPWVAERHAVVQPLLERSRELLDPNVAAVIDRAHEYSATDTFRAIYTLREAQRDTAALWQRVDVLMVPTAPRHPSFAEVAADPLGANAALGLYTNFVNLLGWCAIALPATLTAQGLPFGVTFIAPAGCDAALVELGRAWQRLAAQAPGRPGLFAATDDDPTLPRPASEKTLPIAVVGAHLSGLPLNGQLRERGATLREATQTAAAYCLYALPGTTPAKPGLQRVREGGRAIAVEVWDLPQATLGSFLALIPPPLGLGSIELADGRHVHGFLCEAHALESATDISRFGGWRAYLQQGAS